MPTQVAVKHSRDDVNKTSEHSNPSAQKVEVAAWATDRKLQHEWQGKIDEGGSTSSAGFAPIQARMGQENRDAAYEQAKKTEGRYPVCDAHQGRMPRSIQNV